MFRAPVKRENLMTGRGLFTSIKNSIPLSDQNGRPSFNGEHHAVLKLDGARTGIANFMGPGTEVIKRLSRGDPPRTASDQTAMRHDIDYMEASFEPTVEKQKVLIRTADKRMIDKLKQIEANKADSRFNTLQGKKLIQAKVAAEDRGIISPSRFAGPLAAPNPGDKEILSAAKDKLIQQGYGKHPVDLLKKKAIKQMLKTGGSVKPPARQPRTLAERWKKHKRYKDLMLMSPEDRENAQAAEELALYGPRIGKGKRKSTQKGGMAMAEILAGAATSLIPGLQRKHKAAKSIPMEGVKRVLTLIGKDHLNDTGKTALNRVIPGLFPLVQKLSGGKFKKTDLIKYASKHWC